MDYSSHSKHCSKPGRLSPQIYFMCGVLFTDIEQFPTYACWLLASREIIESQGYLLPGLKKAKRVGWGVVVVPNHICQNGWMILVSAKVTLLGWCFYNRLHFAKYVGRKSVWERCLARGRGTGNRGCGRVVKGNPFKHQALSEGMNGIGGDTLLTPPPYLIQTLLTPPSLLFVPQSSCLTNWCFFFTAIWSCPCCADGKLSGKCYFNPPIDFFPLFLLLFKFCFNFSHVYFPLIRAPMLHRLKILCIRIHSAAWILSCICITLRTLSFCLFSVFFTVIHNIQFSCTLFLCGPFIFHWNG